MDWNIFFNYGIPSALLFYILIRGEKILGNGMKIIDRNTDAIERLETLFEKNFKKRF